MLRVNELRDSLLLKQDIKKGIMEPKMIKSINEIETFEVKEGKYVPSRKVVKISPVKNCEGQLTEITISGKKVIVDSANLVIAARNTRNTGSGLKEEFTDNAYTKFGIEGMGMPELKA